MTRALLLALVAGIVWLYATAFFLARPAHSAPYDCLLVSDANILHNSRGDTMEARKPRPEGMLYLWKTIEGTFIVVFVPAGSPLACIVLETPYDPRESIEG